MSRKVRDVMVMENARMERIRERRNRRRQNGAEPTAGLPAAFSVPEAGTCGRDATMSAAWDLDQRAQ